MVLVAPRRNPERGVGVEPLGEVGMVADADEVETSVVREASMPDHLAHLVDTDLQPEAEENFVAVSHETHSIRTPRYLHGA